MIAYRICLACGLVPLLLLFFILANFFINFNLKSGIGIITDAYIQLDPAVDSADYSPFSDPLENTSKVDVRKIKVEGLHPNMPVLINEDPPWHLKFLLKSDAEVLQKEALSFRAKEGDEEVMVVEVLYYQFKKDFGSRSYLVQLDPIWSGPTPSLRVNIPEDIVSAIYGSNRLYEIGKAYLAALVASGMGVMLIAFFLFKSFWRLPQRV